MKRAFLKLFGFAVILSTSACSKEELLTESGRHYKVDYNDVQLTANTLSVDQALNNMNFAYRNFDKKQQKERRIRTVELLKSSHLRSSTRSGNTEDVPLAYIVNFEDENGYAILGADYRVPPIIMLGDEGNFSTEKYLNFLESSSTRSHNDIDLTNPDNFHYAMITNGLGGSIGDLIIPGIIPSTPHPRDTMFLFKVWPLVKTKFSQESPYNYYAPILPTENNMVKKALAGCVPVAAAQVFTSVAYRRTLYNFPNIEATDGTSHDIDWISILRSVADTIKYNTNQNTVGSKAIAKLIYAIGACTEISYGIEYTGASPYFLSSVYSQLGFENAVYTNFSKEKVFDMIVNKQLPVFTSAADSYPLGGMGQHAFVLDGWLRLQYTFDELKTEGDSGVMSDLPIPQQYTFDLIHCNLGYGGQYDGYYTPGSINLTSSEFWGFADENDNPELDYIMYDISVKTITFNL